MLKAFSVTVFVLGAALAGSARAQFSLSVSQPAATPGSPIVVVDANGAAGNRYMNVMTVVSGGFPGGWCYGVDIPVLDLVVEYVYGPPFSGVLGTNGGASFTTVAGAPSGVTLYVVGLELTPLGVPLHATIPFTYTTL